MLANIRDGTTAGLARNQSDTYIGVDEGGFAHRRKSGLAVHVIQLVSNPVRGSAADIGSKSSLCGDEPVM
jgi:deoxyinosine 3'endonuclease (endonuclease V)